MDSILFDNKQSQSESALFLHVTHRFHLLHLSHHACGRAAAVVTVPLGSKQGASALGQSVFMLLLLMELVGLVAGQWASDHGRAHGGGRVFLTLCK